MTVFVVIPSYNEHSVLRDTVAGVMQMGYDVVLVDDGSGIPAFEDVRGLRVHYLRHVINMGQGAALETGTQYALAQGADVIVHFDADGQHDPALIASLIEPIRAGEADVVLASRFLKPEDERGVPLAKRIALRVGVVVSWMFTRVWLSDTHNGFRALSRGAAEKIRLTENGFAHATEILSLVRDSGLRCREVAARTRYTEYSRSKGQSVFNGINIIVDLVIHRLMR